MTVSILFLRAKNSRTGIKDTLLRGDFRIKKKNFARSPLIFVGERVFGGVVASIRVLGVGGLNNYADGIKGGFAHPATKTARAHTPTRVRQRAAKLAGTNTSALEYETEREDEKGRQRGRGG